MKELFERAGRMGQFNDELVMELLLQMDTAATETRGLFVVGAAVHPGLVDEMVLSRFEEWVDVSPAGAALPPRVT